MLRAMGCRAWWWLVLFGLPGCAGGYALEPTPCDDYCHATKGLQCNFYSPVGCVINCEQQKLGAEACRPQLEAVVGCFTSPSAADSACYFYDYPGEPPCGAEHGALLQCAWSLTAAAATPEPGASLNE